MSEFTQISIKPFYQDWEKNQGLVIYAHEFWKDITKLLFEELSPD